MYFQTKNNSAEITLRFCGLLKFAIFLFKWVFAKDMANYSIFITTWGKLRGYYILPKNMNVKRKQKGPSSSQGRS